MGSSDIQALNWREPIVEYIDNEEGTVWTETSY